MEESFTGQSLCIEKTAFAIAAASENNPAHFSRSNTHFPRGKVPPNPGFTGLAVAEVALCAEHHFMRASYRLIMEMNCDLCHTP
jgi:hypothetical protein